MRIELRNLIFVNDLKKMDSDTLANQIFTEQVKHGFTGLAKEAEALCKEIKHY